MAINNILCVDDESTWREIFQMRFQEYLTPNVDLAEDYESGLTKIRKKHYDLIILDSLEGDCFRIYANIQKVSHGDVVIFSGNVQIESEAKKQGIPFYSKSRATENLDKIVAQYKPATE
ncbi:MAG: response regulator [Nanoarchaeota archaeon]